MRFHFRPAKIVCLFFFILFWSGQLAAKNEFKTENLNLIFLHREVSVSDFKDCQSLRSGVGHGSTFRFEKLGKVNLLVMEKDGKATTYRFFVVPGIVSVLPPLVAILLALLLKDVVIALFIGIFSGALLLDGFNFFRALLRIVDDYVITALTDRNRASIIVFTLLLGGMVGVVSKAGGLKGIVQALSRYALGRRSTLFFTFLMGVIIFFDDYTNTLLVGNTMRPLTDRFRISREKLAYIVDSTAAPVASLAIISTWIGFEISLIDQSLQSLQMKIDSYSLFLRSIPFRFYPLLTLFFILQLIILRRDFGPMLRVEKRASSEGKVLADGAVPLSDFNAANLQPDEKTPLRWFNGLIPILTVIFATIFGLYFSGLKNLTAQKITFPEGLIRKIGMIITSADTFQVLLWASFCGVLVAFGLIFAQRIGRVSEVSGSFIQGIKSMLMAIVILVLAWSLGEILIRLKTADYLVSILSAHLSFRLLPAIVFLLSCFISFATGSSWGTVAIVYPLVIPMAAALLPEQTELLRFLPLTIASIMSGAVFGDHCSPISDTTIMSSMASGCDHLDHVRTQFPYAVFTALLGMIFLIVPLSFGLPYALMMTVAVLFSIFFVRFFGKEVKVEDK